MPCDQHSLFDRWPQLPAVPVPWPGEALGGWIKATVRPYGLSVQDFLQRLGVRWSEQRSHFEVHALLNVTEEFLQSLNRVTGISASCLRGMTLSGLEGDVDLMSACFRHYSPCLACEREAERGAGRRVELLQARSPWRLLCPKHPDPLLLKEVDHLEGGAGFLQKVREIIQELEDAYKNSLCIEGSNGDVREKNRLGDFIRFVYLLNSFVFVRPESFDDLWNRAVFRLIHTFERDPKGRPVTLPPETRNHIGISLVLAWQLAFKERNGLLLGLRTANDAGRKGGLDSTQLTALLTVAKEYWSDDMPLWLLFKASPHKMTDTFRNLPDYSKILSEVSWNYRTAIQVFFSGDVYRFCKPGISEFPKTGPFQYTYMPSQMDTVGLWEYRKKRAAGKRKPRFGLCSYRSRPISKPENEHVPFTTLKSSEISIRSAVNHAMETYGPIPQISNLKDHRRVLRQLQRLAEGHLRLQSC